MRRSAATATAPSTPRVLLELLVGLDLIPRVALLRTVDPAISRALFSDDRHILGIHGASCPPSITLAALACFMQLVYESALVILTSDYTLLGSQHSWAEHTGSWSGVLRRSVRKIGEAGQSRH